MNNILAWAIVLAILTFVATMGYKATYTPYKHIRIQYLTNIVQWDI